MLMKINVLWLYGKEVQSGMPQIKVTLSANAGVCIEAGGKKIWVDALYANADPAYSTMSPELCRQVLGSQAFAAPDYICYTHCHGDHYSRELTQKAMKMWPEAKVFLPQQELYGQILLSGQEYTFSEGQLRLRFVKLPHAGQQYTDVPLYGLIISLPHGNILLPGDCEVAHPALKAAVGDERINLAIVDFPWITLRRGMEYLLESIRPGHILAYHLPFAQDDVNGYRQSAQRAASRFVERDVRLLWDPLQTEMVEI